MNAQIPLWVIFTLLAAAVAANAVWDWLTDQYEFYWFGITRRWYGTRSHVLLRGTEDDEDADRYVVLAWDDGEVAVPSLKVHKLDGEYLTYWDEDSEAFWAPVTGFAPYAVRRVRPHFTRFGPVSVPWLTRYMPLRRPVGHLEGGA